MASLEAVLSEIDYLGRAWRPEILYRSRGVIIFREVEDLIAWVLKHLKRVISAKDPAWRYYCREGDGHNRYYYMIEVIYGNKPIKGPVNPFVLLERGEARQIKLIAGDATDYSGHGSRDKALIETFIRQLMGLRMEDRPASYLIDELIGILEGTRGRGRS